MWTIVIFYTNANCTAVTPMYVVIGAWFSGQGYINLVILLINCVGRLLMWPNPNCDINKMKSEFR